jgi:uncharacterized protein with von Willebrand factor type A (vWA) domain
MRRRLDDQIKGARTEVDESYERRISSVKKRWRAEAKEREGRKEELEKRYRVVDRDADLEEALMDDHLVSMVIEGPELTRWQRFVAWLKRGWYRFVSALVRSWRWLTGKKKASRGPRKGSSRRLLLRGIGVEDRFGKALFSSPALKREIDDRLLARDDLEGDLSFYKDHEQYMDAAVEAFNQYMREKRHEVKKRSKKDKRRLEDRIKRLTKEERRAERELERRLEELAREREKELAQIQEQATEGPRKEIEKEIASYLKRIGYLKEGPEGPVVTSRVIDRFAEFIYHSEMEALPSRLQARTGQAESKHGAYERTRLRTVHEVSKMDLIESLVRSRISHPGHRHIEDEDIIINREVSSERSHIILMFDKSSSMEENQRILAAKKAVLALYKAAKRANPRNIVDLATFDTRVTVTDLDELWSSTPSGFTNTGEAIKVARSLIEPSRADKKMIYLITDGLPEAYTNEEGRAKAGDRKRSLDYALEQAGKLARVRDQRLIVLLLEPEEEMYVEAATTIVKKAAGSIIVTDPKHLAGEMLVDYAMAKP